MNRLHSCILFVFSLTFLAPQAHAYDQDTHFYGTYAMARFAGIRHEVAMKLALAAQWMDESYISDPTSMVFLPVSGVKKRRLLHFPSSRVVGVINADTQHVILGFSNMSDMKLSFFRKFAEFVGYHDSIEALNLFTETEEDHEFASELLMRGMKRGNLMMAGASLHTLEDSFAHAGTPAEQGHAAIWHWPDRPFGAMIKYRAMVETVFTALVGIRQLLPPDALDCSRGIPSTDVTGPACSLDAHRLADAYFRQVYDAVSYNVLRDPSYIEVAIRDFYQRAVKAKYIVLPESDFNALLAKPEYRIDGRKDAYEVLQGLITWAIEEQFAGRQNVLNFCFILSDMGRLPLERCDTVADYIRSQNLNPNNPKDMSNFTRKLARQLLRWNVPTPISDTHWNELENDQGPVRAKEMEIRISRIRQVITRLYGIDIELVGNNTLDSEGFAKEVTMDPSAEPKIEYKPNKIYATFGLREKHEWDMMIFNYLFPSLKKEDLISLMKVSQQLEKSSDGWDEYVAARKKINKSSDNLVSKKAQLIALDFKYKHLLTDYTGAVVDLVSQLQPLAEPFFHDLVTTHITPSDDNLYYRDQTLFKKYQDNGVVKKFLGPEDIWTLANLRAEGLRKATLR